jgi:hypothetical protein
MPSSNLQIGAVVISLAMINFWATLTQMLPPVPAPAISELEQQAQSPLMTDVQMNETYLFLACPVVVDFLLFSN